jgi:hypothetical protein
LPFAATAGVADVDAVTLAASSLVRGGLEPSDWCTRRDDRRADEHVGEGRHRVRDRRLALRGALFCGGLAATIAAAAVWFLVTPLIAPMFGEQVQQGASLAAPMFG